MPVFLGNTQTTIDKPSSIGYNRNMKTYEDGVKAERERIAGYLLDVGNQLETYVKYGKRRYRKQAKTQVQAIVAILEFVDPTVFDENN
jgi:hypothetical protein